MKILRSLGLLASFTLLVTAIAGCKSAPSEEEAIRAAVRQRLSSLGTLNLQAMDLDFTRVSVQNNQATADVSFRPKTGAPAGAAMQVSYQLEKQDGAWRVVKTSGMGGMIEHPSTTANPHMQGGPDVHGRLPNFQDVLGSNSPSGAASAPPPHNLPRLPPPSRDPSRLAPQSDDARNSPAAPALSFHR